MRKFECNDCEADCELTIQMDEFRPTYCLYNKEEADWHEVKEEACKVSMKDKDNSMQDNKLPDWVKVGELVYCSITGDYAEITEIKEEVINIHILNSIASYSVDIDKFLQRGYPARKRPFNEDEMKALVGKILTHKQTGDLTLVTDFINEYDKDLDYHYSTVFAFGENYTDGDLMDDCTIDGKPCYVLEHLENGEWVE